MALRLVTELWRVYSLWSQLFLKSSLLWDSYWIAIPNDLLRVKQNSRITLFVSNRATS
jgi:hypothetical protein